MVSGTLPSYFVENKPNFRPFSGGLSSWLVLDWRGLALLASRGNYMLVREDSYFNCTTPKKKGAEAPPREVIATLFFRVGDLEQVLPLLVVVLVRRVRLVVQRRLEHFVLLQLAELGLRFRLRLFTGGLGRPGSPD